MTNTISRQDLYLTNPELMDLTFNVNVWLTEQGREIPDPDTPEWSAAFEEWLAQSPIPTRLYDIARRNPNMDLWCFREEDKNLTDGFTTAELRDIYREMMAGKIDLLDPCDPHWKNPFSFKIPTTVVNGVKVLVWDARKIQMAITSIAFMCGDKAKIRASLYPDMEIISEGYQCW